MSPLAPLSPNIAAGYEHLDLVPAPLGKARNVRIQNVKYVGVYSRYGIDKENLLVTTPSSSESTITPRTSTSSILSFDTRHTSFESYEGVATAVRLEPLRAPSVETLEAPSVEPPRTPSVEPLRTPAVQRSKAPLVKRPFSLLPKPAFHVQRGRNALPPEVVECIVKHLEAAASVKDPTSHVGDLYNLSLTSREWDRAVREYLYRTISIRIVDLAAPPRKLLSRPPKSRLKCLRRTLRNRPFMGSLVREIRVLDYPDLDSGAVAASEEIRNNLASLVMACPKLERLIGFDISYRHEFIMACSKLERLTGFNAPEHDDFDRLAYALSTRQSLKEHSWTIGPERRANNLDTGSRDSLQLPSTPYSNLGTTFADHHTRWTSLETLILTSTPDGTLHPRALSATFPLLPNLRHLRVSHFPAQSFNDTHLDSLPFTLSSLHLDSLPGISEVALLSYLTFSLPHPVQVNLSTLTIRQTAITNLSALSLLLRHLPALENLTLQTSSLSPPPKPQLHSSAPPYCASASLRRLHIDITPWTNSPTPLRAHELLAADILAGAFPSLTHLRVPSDPGGILQAVCRPLVPPSSLSVGAGPLPRRMREDARVRAALALAPGRRVGVEGVCRFSVIGEGEREGRGGAFVKIRVRDEGAVLVEAYDTPRFLGRVCGGAPVYVVEGDEGVVW